MKALLKEMLEKKKPLMPIAELLGIGFISYRTNEAETELTVADKHLNAFGTLHGGVFCELADVAMGLALATAVSEDDTYTLVEIKVNFVRPIWSGRVLGKGRVLRRGRTIVLTTCEIFDAQNQLAAFATGTAMILDARQAKGREVKPRPDCAGS